MLMMSSVFVSTFSHTSGIALLIKTILSTESMLRYGSTYSHLPKFDTTILLLASIFSSLKSVIVIVPEPIFWPLVMSAVREPDLQSSCRNPHLNAAMGVHWSVLTV